MAFLAFCLEFEVCLQRTISYIDYRLKKSFYLTLDIPSNVCFRIFSCAEECGLQLSKSPELAAESFPLTPCLGFFFLHHCEGHKLSGGLQMRPKTVRGPKMSDGN